MTHELVSYEQVTMALLERQLEVVNSYSPEVMRLGAVFQQEMLRQALLTLKELGFVVAQDVAGTRTGIAKPDTTTSSYIVEEIVTIYRTGCDHAPGRVEALQDNWPALKEALDRLEADHA